MRCRFCGNILSRKEELMEFDPLWGDKSHEVECSRCSAKGWETDGILMHLTVGVSTEKNAKYFYVTNEETKFSTGPWYIERAGKRHRTISTHFDEALEICDKMNIQEN